MRILWLGNSDDVNASVDEARRAPNVAARIVEERSGAAAEVTIQVLWPRANMPELAGRLMEQTEPDVVVIYVSSFAYSYRSVPLRVQRRLGPLGAPMATAGFKMAASPKLGESRLFHLARRTALRTLGGDTHFTPDEVFERTEAVVRRALAKEDRVVVVRGPASRYDRTPPKGQPGHLEMTERFRRMCTALHVGFVGWEEPVFEASESSELLGDHVHIGADGQTLLGTEVGEAIATAWLAAHPVRGAADRTGCLN